MKGYPKSNNKIPPSNFESFNKRATMQINPDQKNNKYNVKYNLVIVFIQYYNLIIIKKSLFFKLY